jgi:hypothetical protein
MAEYEYGVLKMRFGIDSVDSAVASFGDGLTRISTVGWDGTHSGIQIVRDELCNEPFGKYIGEEADKVNQMPESEKIYLIFDNVRSIDVAIARLEEAKSFLSEEVRDNG